MIAIVVFALFCYGCYALQRDVRAKVRARLAAWRTRRAAQREAAERHDRTMLQAMIRLERVLSAERDRDAAKRAISDYAKPADDLPRFHS